MALSSLGTLGWLVTEIQSALKGTPGKDGKTIVNSVGAPTVDVGVPGDYYFDNASVRLYGPKVAANASDLVGTWPASYIQFVNTATAGARMWAGTAITDATGRWTVDMTGAGFTATPVVVSDVIASGLTAALAASSRVTSSSKTAASGTVTLPLAVVLGGLGVSLAGAGMTVNVIAIGN